jgi:hypothetical protein
VLLIVPVLIHLFVNGLIYLLIKVFGHIVAMTVSTAIITIVGAPVRTTGIITLIISQKGIYYGTRGKGCK